MNEPYVRKRELPVGVYRNRSARYMAIVRHNGERNYLGSYDSKEEAAEAVALFRKHHPKEVRKYV